MQNQDIKTSKAFEALEKPQDIIDYLNAKSRLNTSKQLYQYTSVSALVNMIKSRTMHLANAKFMNDQLEYSNGDPDVWKNLFFTCFMSEEDESIGMWSMYAQPWRDGIKISIPRDILRQWVSETQQVIEISQETKRPTGRKLALSDTFSIWISAVAYSNRDGIDLKRDEEVLRCGGQTNKKIINAPHIAELTGYIKDMAWSYEKEVRVKIQFDNWRNFERIAIPLPDYVIDSMVITPSPLFEGDLKQRLELEIERQLKTSNSKFIGKLSIRSACDSCTIKVANDRRI